MTTTKRTALTAIRFTEFCAQVLGIRLTTGQRVLCLVAFDGVQPEQLDGADREIAREIFGGADAIPPSARHVLAAMCGARGGKSFLFSHRLLHLALTVRLDSLAPGEHAFGLIVAPDTRLARQALRYVTGRIEETPSIAKLVVAETADSITLRRPDGKTVTIECLPATRGGSAVRGRSLFGALMDEACFFRDDDGYLVNDTEVYKAIAPRVVADGQLLIGSTPWMESGLLHDLYTANKNTPTTAIAAHAPTLLLRDDDHTRSIVERERVRDPDNATREFDAVPLSAGTTAFFDPIALKACVIEDSPRVIPPKHFERAHAGLDTAFKRDASAIVVVRPTGQMQEHLDLAEVFEITPPKGGRLVPSITIKALLERAKFHRCTRVIADQHYIETVREHTYGFGVSLVEAPGGLSGKVDAYLKTRNALNEGRLRIPAGNEKLISQLREVVSKPTAGGGLAISSPRRAGSHGDIASAFVLAVWSCVEQPGTGELKGTVGSSAITRALSESTATDSARLRARQRDAQEFRLRLRRKPRRAWD